MMRVSPGASRRCLLLLLAVLSLSFLALPLGSAQAQVGSQLVIQADIEGTITFATLEHFKEVLDIARRDQADAIILRLNTPGGGLAETLEITELILTEVDIPIIGYVHPSGASAASAGTMILMATDLAAMTPATTIGSVQPVIITATGSEPVTDNKTINFLVEKIESHLAAHGRNESLANAFVRDNLNLNSDGALEAGAIEIVADDVDDLLAQADGLETYYKGIRLDFSNPSVRVQGPSLRLQFLLVITDPVLASIILLLGIYGVIFGISTPGHGAEILGTIGIALGIIGLGFNVNLVAIFLLGLGVALLIVEIATPSFGIIGAGGIISIILGTIFLAPISPPTFLITPEQQLQILILLLIPTAVMGVFLLFALYKVLQARREKPYLQQIIGGKAEATEPIGPGKRGHVRYDGELWRAVSEEEIKEEEEVYILKRDGTVLTVSKEPPAPSSEEEREARRPTENPLARWISSLRRSGRQGGKP